MMTRVLAPAPITLISPGIFSNSRSDLLPETYGSRPDQQKDAFLLVNLFFVLAMQSRLSSVKTSARLRASDLISFGPFWKPVHREPMPLMSPPSSLSWHVVICLAGMQICRMISLQRDMSD